MGADQGYGKMTNSLPEYVQNPDCTEVYKIFRNSSNGLWYTKTSTGVVALFDAKGYLAYRGSLTQVAAGNPSAFIIKSDVGILTFIRDSAGVYKCDLTLLGYDYKKITYSMTCNTGNVTDSFNVKIRNDNVLEIRTSTGGVLSDDLLLRSVIMLEFFS